MRLRNFLALPVLLLPLMGNACDEPAKIITRLEYVPLDIPESLLVCRAISQAEFDAIIPDVTKLTDRQLGNLIKTYENHLNTCVANMSAIRKYVRDAKAEFEKRQANR